jgi:hypothetical protein
VKNSIWQSPKDREKRKANKKNDPRTTVPWLPFSVSRDRVLAKMSTFAESLPSVNPALLLNSCKEAFITPYAPSTHLAPFLVALVAVVLVATLLHTFREAVPAISMLA